MSKGIDNQVLITATLAVTVTLLAASSHNVVASGRQTVDEPDRAFDQKTLPSWAADVGTAHTSIERSDEQSPDGPFSRFRMLNSATSESIRIEARLPWSLLHQEFQAQVRLRASNAGLRTGLLIVLPHQTDPRTGRALHAVIAGERLQESETWQSVTITTTAKIIDAQIRRWRAELNRGDINAREALIAGVVVLAEAVPGESFIDLADVQFGPVIDPPANLVDQLQRELPEAAASPVPAQFIPMDVELGSITLNGKAVILRMAPDHREHFESLQQLGLNAIWVPDFRETDRARQLADVNLAVIATPPHPEFQPGDFSTLLHALPPLDQQCPSVSAWYTGTRVPSSALPHLLSWSREIRSADRALQRPQMADLVSHEGAAAREIDLVGLGRPVIGRDDSFVALRNLLVRRQRSAGQLSFPWMWIQTEPSSDSLNWRNAIGASLPVVEPEQIQHQVYAALSAGYKGLGFWKTSALKIDDPLDRERALAIELACLEIDVLEPFLANGRLEGHLALQPVTNDGRKPVRLRDGAPQFINSALSGRAIGNGAVTDDAGSGLDAAVIRSDRSVLILGVAWDASSQFVPGPMHESEVRLVVAASETASAWQISPTGVRSLPREVTAGGLSIRLSDFDRCGCVLVSSDTDLVARLRERVQASAERAASAEVELASLKHMRVRQTVEDLRDEHSVPSGVDPSLAAARNAIDRAEQELASKNFADATKQARLATRSLRQIQRACWSDALAELTSPASSPHAIAFSTLPDHWRLMHYVAQQNHRVSENLLPSGTFDNLKSLRDEGWESQVVREPSLSATADVIADSGQGQILRMIAWMPDSVPRNQTADVVSPLTVKSPTVPVESGDVVLVSGRIRRGRAVTSLTDRSVRIMDSETSFDLELRPELNSDWQTFEFMRPIAADSDFRLLFALDSQAEVLIDDLQIRRLLKLVAE